MVAMKTKGQDILTSRPELKGNPFSTPEGYFESFKLEMSRKVEKPRASIWKSSIPYMAVAASLALILSVGTLIMNRIGTINDLSDEDYILFSNSSVSTAEYEDSESYQFAEAELMDEDIIEYLIYVGASPESIELSK